MAISEKLTAIAENQQKVYDAGYAKGKADGGDTETAYQEGYDAGKQSEYDRFWNGYQENGERGGYLYAFAGRGWTDETFKPKWDLRPVASANFMFRDSYITDMVSNLEVCGVALDFSSCQALEYAFAYSQITRLGIIDTRAATKLSYMCYSCKNLTEIEKVIFADDGMQEGSNPFLLCNSLQEIRIEGAIGTTVSFLNSPLSVESMKSIILALIDNTGTGFEYQTSVKFSTTCWNALEATIDADDETTLPPDGGTSWKDYVFSTLSWNV